MPLRSRVVRNFFKGLSVTQLSAGALAAVTSFLLSAKIGIAGSVIGVAVGSIVSAVIRETAERRAVPCDGRRGWRGWRGRCGR